MVEAVQFDQIFPVSRRETSFWGGAFSDRRFRINIELTVIGMLLPKGALGFDIGSFIIEDL